MNPVDVVVTKPLVNNSKFMNYLAELYSSLFHKRKEEIFVGQLNVLLLDFIFISE